MLSPVDIALNIFSLIAVDTSWSMLTIPANILMLIGFSGIFRKCGGKVWWAWVPCYRYYKLAQCADREAEGRTFFWVHLISILIEISTFFIITQNTFGLMIMVVNLMVQLIRMVYFIRIGLGLIELFGRRKSAVLLWLFLPFVASMLWGWRKKHQPKWQISDVLQDDAAGFFSGSKAAVLDNGLTVNLEERTVTQFFKKKYLLRDIHLYLQPGHMVLLLGGSGAGKTTFLNAVNGYEKAKAEVTLNGRNMYKNYKEMQYDIGFVPQQDLMRGSDTVLRTLMDAAALRLPSGFTAAERRARVHEVIDIFGLTHAQNTLVSILSGGQRKRLSIAMEFISNPTLFILDEPDSGLDGVMARELFQQLRNIADQGKIIIVITHTPDRVIDLFDDVIVLAKDSNRVGRAAFFGPIEEAREFFGKDKMEEIVKSINRKEEGGEGRADEYIQRFVEVQHA